MENFIYSIPTTIYFGKGQIRRLGKAVKEYGSKALIVYGGGSIKKNGIFDAAVQSLSEAGVSYVELGGVEPNPRVTTVKKGADLCKAEGVEVVLPIGGGSTIDCAKAIAAAAFYDGDPWDLVLNPREIKKVLPIVSVLTLAATGSEMDIMSVITNMETNDKLAFGHREFRPKASILDPTYTFTVNAYHTAAGTVDIMSHTLESYFSNVEAYMQARMAEGILKTCIAFGGRAVENPEDYEARANLMWASSWAINNFLTWGNPVAWTVHPMEHELSAYYDITHGAGLAILTPPWMRYVLNADTVKKFKEYGVNVWNLDPKGDDFEVANAAIEKTAEYFKKLGMPSTLKEVGIGPELLDTMAEKAAKSLKGAYVELTKEQVKEIYEAAL